jgi:hypothetical protein
VEELTETKRNLSGWLFNQCPCIILIGCRVFIMWNHFNCICAKWVGVVVNILYLCGRFLLWISARLLALPKVFYLWVSEPLQANSRILPQLWHDWFLPNPLQFISHPAIRLLTAS